MLIKMAIPERRTRTLENVFRNCFGANWIVRREEEGGERERDHPIASGEAFVAEKYHANQCQEKRLAYSVVCLTLC